MKKNYNIYRTRLHLPEYGRHIQDMVDELQTIDNRELRNRKAQTIITIMGNLQPSLRDTPDYGRKLWDHLFIMAEFKLDIDSPYPIPTPKTLNITPRKMDYPDGQIAMKHYGKNVRDVIRLLERVDDQRVVQAVVNNLARYMRTKSYEYNQEHPVNEMIIKDIKRMSENGITVDEDAINHIKSEYKQPFNNNRSKKIGYVKKNGKPVKGGMQRRMHPKQ